MTKRSRKTAAAWRGRKVAPGERANLTITVSRSYSGTAIRLPIHVWRGRKKGPTVFVSAAVHGDELNGIGAIRTLILDPPFQLKAGSLILAPVLNILAFERLSRYSPDRRDLNRCFPGIAKGSLTSRLARVVFDNIVARSDYGIDLHSAAARRTNYPNIRADMDDDETARLASLFGAELLINAKGPTGSLRREARRAGCPTIVLEAGEVWKVEPSVVEYSLRGIENVLKGLNMVEGEVTDPAFRMVAEDRTWIRAAAGGFLQFHVVPGDVVVAGQALATNISLVGESQNVIEAPRDAVVLGMTTLPAVSPGDPVCHLAFPSKKAFKKMEKAINRLSKDSLFSRLHGDLATNMVLSDAEQE